MKEKCIVVTGGAGFIGSNLVRMVCQENEVTVIDDLSTGHLENIEHLIDHKKISFIRGSITDASLLKKALKDIDVVFHQAAVVSVPQSIKDPLTTNTVNIDGTLQLLHTARQADVEKIVCASSCAVYGEPRELPLKETTVCGPLSPYAVSKLAVEYYGDLFSQLYGLPTVSLRYFNVYGPSQDPHSDYAAVMPLFLSRVLSDNSLIIYGDGEQTRDFIFVEDVVRANVLSAESTRTGIFNIAGGNKISINELAHCVMDVTGKRVAIEYAEARPGDIHQSYADISKAKQMLAFTPQTSLQQGLEKTLAWLQQGRTDS